MKKLQYALLLTCLIGWMASEMNMVAADDAGDAAIQADRVLLASAESDENPADEKSAAKTQTVFRPVLNPVAREKENQRVHVKIYPLYNKLARGERCPVAIELTVQNGWHINANPQSPDFLIPTAIKFKSQQKVSLTKTLYPKHKTHTMQQESAPYHVYDGKVMIYCLLEIDEKERTDYAKLEFTVRYQACNDDRCEKPANIVMKGQLPVVDPGDDIRMIYKDKFPKPGAAGNAGPAPGE